MPLRGFAVSVRGASHESGNIPCQDSARVLIGDSLAIAAVSDGHGSEKHFRSAAGSEMAARIAVRSITDFCERNGSLSAVFSGDPAEAARRVAANIICGWNDEIAAHLRFSPLSERERAISDKFGGLSPEIMYGATLILAAADGDGVFGLQIGDGSFVMGAGGAETLPMPEDERLVGNLTTSLCDCDAINSFRSFWREGGFSHIVISSDGLINSFVSRDDFLSFCGRTAALSQQELPALEKHLRERSRAGSRDDISAAVITPALK